MMKKLVFATALLSLALLAGCAKGGNGPCVENCPTLSVVGTSSSYAVSPIGQAGLGMTISFAVNFVHVSTQPVNWNITGASCTNPTDASNPCGYFTATTTSSANYQAPSTVPATPTFDIVATSQTDGSLSGTVNMRVVPDVASVSPLSPNVGVGLTQEYAASATPGGVPQTFAWTCTTANGPCANFTTDQNLPGLAYYKPTAGEVCSGGGSCVTVSAVVSLDPTGCSVDPKNPCVPSQTTVVSSRVPNGPYAFQFSGYDKNGKAIAVAGTFTVASGGAISGFEDESEWNGSAFVTTQHSFSGGSYSPLTGSNPTSNNAGALSLNTGVFPSTYQVVLDGAGDVQMIASDGSGNSGFGIAESSSISKFNQGTAAVFAFGFTGADSSNNRVGYAGLLPTDGISAVTGGLIDVNDNGSASNSVCASAPCTVTGSYTYNSGTNRGQLTLTSPQTTLHFDFFVANGNSSNPNNPLNLYAISTDSNPAVVGTMALQNSKVSAYNNAAFAGTSVSALAGANGNVALILGSTYGDNDQPGVTGACPNSGSGSFTGNFDQNNAGTIVTVSSFPSAAQTTNPYTYIATNSNTGRYIFCMLGNTDPKSTVLPIPFVMYASGANRGFLLDQSSPSVMTGTMSVQTAPKNGGFFANSTAVGTYAVATSGNGVANASGCSQLPGCAAIMNPVVTAPVVPEASGIPASNITGVVNPNNVPVSLIFNLGSNGYGTINPQLGVTTTPPNYVIYAVTATDFFMIDVDSGVMSPILYLAQ